MNPRPVTASIDAADAAGRHSRACRRLARLAATGLVTSVAVFGASAQAGYLQTNLVSSIPGHAVTTDPDLVNPWGLAASPTGPFWVSDNGTGLSTLYNDSGTKQGLVVTIPTPGSPAPGAPTGQVFNGGAAFNGDRFLFSTEDGTIAGWRPALGTSAEVVVDNSALNANYKGLTIGTNAAGRFIFAANFRTGKIDVFDGSFNPTITAGAFTDPTLPAGYAPFNIQNIGGRLYVAYAARDAAGNDEIAGPGLGFVDVFDTDGNLIQRLISGGALDAPWGFALAPADFGEFSNSLLVGNFGDGRINAFDPASGNLLGALTDGGGTPISIDGLWGLSFGNGGAAGATNVLFFTAGINDEEDGLFGKLSTIPEPATGLLAALGFAIHGGLARRRRVVC